MNRARFIKAFCASIGYISSISRSTMISTGIVLGCKKIDTPISNTTNPTIVLEDFGAFIKEDRIVDYRFSEGAGQKIHNFTELISDDNIIPVPEQTFNNKPGHFELFTKVNATVTDLYAENPWSEPKKASRIVTNRGAANGIKITIPLAAGFYTISLYIKSHRGNTQTMRMEAPRGTYSGIIPVSDSWTRQSFGFTALSGNNQIFFVKNNASGDALDILIDGLKINSGSSAGEYVRPKFDITFGYTGTTESSDPMWNNRGIALSSAFGTGMSSSGFSLSKFTAYVFAKLNVNTSKQSYVLMEPYDDFKFCLKWGAGGSPDTANSPTVRIGRTAIYQQIGHVSDGIPHLIVSQYTGTRLLMWIDGSLVIDTGISAGGAVNLQRLILSSNDTLAEYFEGEIYYASIYKAVHDAEQRAFMRDRVLEHIATPRNIAMHVYSEYVVFEGDSISTVGSNGEWPRHLARLFNPPFVGFCNAKVGSTVTGVTSLDARKDEVVALFDPGKSKNILTILIGANDLVSIDGVTVKNRLKTYCEYIKAHSGYVIVLCTPVDRSTHPEFQTNRSEYVNALLADPDFYDYLVRLDLDSRVGIKGCSRNTNYFFPDGVHPNDGGNAVVAELVKPTVEAILSA